MEIIPRLASRIVLFFLLLGSGLIAVAQSASEVERLAPVVVTAGRATQATATLPVAVDVFTSNDLQRSPSLTLDDTLRASAAFSLFRRSGSLIANPTAQGVSLRALGPSGASRSLVLLDGVPLNDPFGGWISWSKLPRLTLERAEIVRGGGSGLWGNTALGGVIQILTQPADADAAQASATLGDFSTRSGEVALTHAIGNGAVRVSGSAFSTDGVYVVDRPGAIDRRADSQHRWGDFTWRATLTDAVTLTTDARFWREDRGNGTPLQQNHSRETFLSASLDGHPASGPTWSAVAYWQDQTFSSSFTSVNAARTAETPANDQYAVPATAAGGALTLTWSQPGSATTTAGTDARWVRGETRENFLYSGGQFTRRRFAGGEQGFAGVFVRHERSLTERLTGSLAVRADGWQNRQGHRREFDTTTSAVTRDDRYADANGTEFSPTAGLVWAVNPLVRLRASAYRAFRVPTLNEYFRPFRVGAVSVDANAALVPETLDGGEIGLDFGDHHLGGRLTAYQSEIRHAVTNLTIAPNTRQRRNLDRVRGRGLEASAHWQALPALRFETDALLSDSRVTSGGARATALDGKRLAQVPRYTLTAGATWKPLAQTELTARARWTGAQFEDDENILRLAPATTFDFGFSRQLSARWQLQLFVENAFNARIETGRTADGIVNVAPPRLARLSVSFADR